MINSVSLPIIPLVLSVVVGEALFVFGKTTEASGKCYSFPNEMSFCLSTTAYQAALVICGLCFVVAVLMLLRKQS
jgi:hypothetical protein